MSAPDLDAAGGVKPAIVDLSPIAGGRVRILGIDIDDLAFDEAIALLGQLARGSHQRVLFFANANTLELACRSARFRSALGESDYMFGDGTGVRWAARILGVDLKANLNGTDLIPAFMDAVEGQGLKYFLLGATPDVVARTAEVARARFPGMTQVGYHHGFLDDDSKVRVTAAIVAAQPDILLVGMGHPKQEYWIVENCHKLPAKLVVSVGGLFSYLSGDYRRAPSFMRRYGVEWLAILFTQRQKWRRYVFGAPTFLLRVVYQRLCAGRPPN